MQKMRTPDMVKQTRSFLKIKFVQPYTVKVTAMRISLAECYDKAQHLPLLLLLKQMRMALAVLHVVY
jgi:hypothetical protein